MDDLQGGTGATGVTWTPWRVAPRSGFETALSGGNVDLIQIDKKQFVVLQPFRFSNPTVEGELLAKLQRDGHDAATARRMLDDARTFMPGEENPTDLASIPPFMRWFVNTYGAHTLASIIHDQLIVPTANGGPLRSDTLSDRFFREMMGAAGMPWLKRWVMWAAVAMRTRWAAGGWRRWSLVLWLVLAVCGIGAFGWAAGAWILGWGMPFSAGWMWAIALVLPLVAAPLWGRQYGAGLVAAIAGSWVLPAAAFGAAGYAVYWVLERLARQVGLR